tara:strand:+ start:5461 stop:6105 length:645 start_codon:yes stop_codon:yes gene_type:complete
MLKKTKTYITFFICFLIVFILLVTLLYFFTNSNSRNNRICLTIDQYNNLLSNTTQIIPESQPIYDKTDTIKRDHKVLDDDLYPPLNRSDTNTHTQLANNIINRNMYVKTNNIDDTFRLVGYVTNNATETDNGNNSWKLFGRQKDRHSSEFYMTPTNSNNDLKIPLTRDIIVNDKLDDIYSIPNTLTFNSPLLNKEPYNVVEVPKADLSFSSDYL